MDARTPQHYVPHYLSSVWWTEGGKGASYRQIWRVFWRLKIHQGWFLLVDKLYYLRWIIPFRIFTPSVQVFAVVLRLQGHRNVIPGDGFRVGSICLMIPTTQCFIFSIGTRDICYIVHTGDSHELLENDLVRWCTLSGSLQKMDQRSGVANTNTLPLWFIFGKLSDRTHQHTRLFLSKLWESRICSM